MKRLRPWLPALLWMGVIYLMSAMPGDVSGAQSGTLTAILRAALALFLCENAAGISEDALQLIVRKGAHIAEYAILFLLYLRALKRSGAKRPGLAALMLSACYAMTDEYHQGFVAGRGPSAVDVCIDTLGAGIGWGAITIRQRIFHNIRQ